MRKLITFFVNRPVWGNAFIFVVIIFGIFALSNTKKSFFPELDPNTIVVSVFYPGASPNEMEEGVTIKIEQAVKGIAAIDEINSTSSENMATVNIKAYQDADMDQLLSDVENAINSINSFPEGAEKPIIKRLTSGGMGSVVAFIGISAKDKNISDIKTYSIPKTLQKSLKWVFLRKKSRLIFEKMIFCVTILRFKKFQWPSVVKTIISQQGLFVVIYKK